MDKRNQFGQFVTFMKQSVGWSTREMSERTGYPQSTVRKYETGKMYPTKPNFEVDLRATVKEELISRRARVIRVCPEPMREVWFVQWDKEESCWCLIEGWAPYPKAPWRTRSGVPYYPRDIGPLYDPGVEDVAWEPGLLDTLEAVAR